MSVINTSAAARLCRLRRASVQAIASSTQGRRPEGRGNINVFAALADGAGGGGVSESQPVPAWQSKLTLKSVNPGHASGRGVPDVSANADPSEAGSTASSASHAAHALPPSADPRY